MTAYGVDVRQTPAPGSGFVSGSQLHNRGFRPLDRLRRSCAANACARQWLYLFCHSERKRGISLNPLWHGFFHFCMSSASGSAPANCPCRRFFARPSGLSLNDKGAAALLTALSVCTRQTFAPGSGFVSGSQLHNGAVALLTGYCVCVRQRFAPANGFIPSCPLPVRGLPPF